MDDDFDWDADLNDCCHGVEGPCPICDPELVNFNPQWEMTGPGSFTLPNGDTDL
jgi:hypothetical protein